jgi:hypothetical protein
MVGNLHPKEDVNIAINMGIFVKISEYGKKH